MSIKLSLIELGSVPSGQTRSQAIKNMITTAQKVEEWGYHRFWLAEHHNTENFVSRAPEVTIPLIASNTSRIRVGSGSVLLNHYSPFKVAEVFTLLGDMFPGRIDMGIGRATTGPVSDFALQRNRNHRQMSDDSEEQLRELINWLTNGFENDHAFNQIKAHHDGPNLPEFWLLGSSQWSAYAAGILGLNYAFAAFINPDNAYSITQKYRNSFTPGIHQLGGNHSKLMLSLSIYCSDTLENAGKLAAPMILMMQRMMQTGNMNSKVESEDNAVAYLGSVPPASKISDSKVPPRYIIGTPETIKKDLIALASTFEVDEIMVQCISNNLDNRLKCLELLAEVFELKIN